MHDVVGPRVTRPSEGDLEHTGDGLHLGNLGIVKGSELGCQLAYVVVVYGRHFGEKWGEQVLRGSSACRGAKEEQVERQRDS